MSEIYKPMKALKKEKPSQDILTSNLVVLCYGLFSGKMLQYLLRT